MCEQKSTSGDLLHELVTAVDHDGFTPLLRAAEAYKDWTVSQYVYYILQLLLHFTMALDPIYQPMLR